MNNNTHGRLPQLFFANQGLVALVSGVIVALIIAAGFYFSPYKTFSYLLLGIILLALSIEQKWIFHLFIFLLPFDLVLRNGLEDLGYSSYWKEFFVIIIMFAVLMDVLARKKSFVAGKITTLLLALFSYYLLHILFAKSYGLYFEGLKTVAQMFPFFIFGQVYIRSEKDFFSVRKMILLSGICQLIIGTGQIFGIGIVHVLGQLNLFASAWYAMVAGTLSSHHNFGFFLLMLLYLVWEFRSGVNRDILFTICRICFSGVIILNIFMTYSRSTWVSLLSMILFYGFLCRKKTVVAVFILCILSFLVLPWGISERFQSIFEGDTRLTMWRKHLANDFRMHPVFGAGLGMFESAADKALIDGDYYFETFRVVDNLFLKHLLETGLVGLLLEILLLATILGTAFRLRISDDPFTAQYSLFIILLTGTIIILGLFSSSLENFPIGGYFWLFIGVFSRIALEHDSSKPEKIQK